MTSIGSVRAAPILPGATLGILGGGQLGRMFTVAARTLGYRVIVLDPDPHSPAGRIADQHVQAEYTDRVALDELVARCAAVTTEFENIPAASLDYLAKHLPVRPGATALLITQDRIREKQFIQQCGLSTVAFHAVRDATDLEPAWRAVCGDDAAVGTPATGILKRGAFGYDGKGQIRVDSPGALSEAFVTLGEVPCVLEQCVALEQEISVVVARSQSGEAQCYPVAENRHVGGILHTSVVPARISDTLAQAAQTQARALADALDYCGVLAVEFFVLPGGVLRVNEIAPRPHNSGHYTLDACMTSQFEQQVRMVCGLTFGDTRLLSPVVMVNLLGELWSEGQPDWQALFSDPAAKLHLYGKSAPRPGRKMGHYCVLGTDTDTALARAETIYAKLAG